MPKGKSIKKYSSDEVLLFADEINDTPTKRLDYCTPSELFDNEIDKIYSL